MKTVTEKSLSVLLITVIGAWLLMLTSCAYRLPMITPPTQDMFRVVAKAPEQYRLQVNTGRANDYDVPHDGRVKVVIPSLPSSLRSLPVQRGKGWGLW